MGYPTGDIKLSNNFELNASVPIDARIKVDNYSDLVNITFKYPGLISFVVNEDKHYKLSSDLITWTEFGTAPIIDISGKADIESPTFTGIPSVPTAILGNNTTQIASTEFVNTSINAMMNIKKVIYVDGVNGNDTTALKYDPTKPYKTIKAAVLVSVYGDTVWVKGRTDASFYDGDYTPVNELIYTDYNMPIIDGTTIYMEDGVKVLAPDAPFTRLSITLNIPNNRAIFSEAAAGSTFTKAKTWKLLGKGTLIANGNTAQDTCAIVFQNGSESNQASFHIEAKEITSWETWRSGRNTQIVFNGVKFKNGMCAPYGAHGTVRYYNCIFENTKVGARESGGNTMSRNTEEYINCQFIRTIYPFPIETIYTDTTTGTYLWSSQAWGYDVTIFPRDIFGGVNYEGFAMSKMTFQNCSFYNAINGNGIGIFTVSIYGGELLRSTMYIYNCSFYQNDISKSAVVYSGTNYGSNGSTVTSTTNDYRLYIADCKSNTMGVTAIGGATYTNMLGGGTGFSIILDKSTIDKSNYGLPGDIYISSIGVDDITRFDFVSGVRPMTNKNYPLQNISFVKSSIQSYNELYNDLILNYIMMDGGSFSVLDDVPTLFGYVKNINIILENDNNLTSAFQINSNLTKYNITSKTISNRIVNFNILNGDVSISNLHNIGTLSVENGDVIVENCKFISSSSGLSIKGGTIIFRNCEFVDVVHYTMFGVILATNIKFEDCTFKTSGVYDNAQTYDGSCFTLISETNVEVNVMIEKCIFINTSMNTPTIYLGIHTGTVHFYNNKFYNSNYINIIDHYLVNSGLTSYWYLDGNIGNVSTDSNITNQLPSSGVFIDANFKIF